VSVRIPLNEDDRDTLLTMLVMASLEEILNALAVVCRDEAVHADDAAEKARWKRRQRTCLEAAQVAAMEQL